MLGIFGAILGYGGYAQKEWKKEKKGHPIEVDYPEFYEKLRHIKVSVVPKNDVDIYLRKSRYLIIQ